MKKSFIIAVLLPFSSLAVDVSTVYVYSNNASSFTNYSLNVTSPLSLDHLDDFLFSKNLFLGFRYTSNSFQPTFYLTNSTLNVSYPFLLSNGSYAGWSYAPKTYSLFNIAFSLFQSGDIEPLQITQDSATSKRINFRTYDLISYCLFSTNTLYRSSIISALSNINSSLSSIDSTVLSILNSLPPSSGFTPSNVLSFAESLNNFSQENGFNIDVSKLAFDLNPSNWADDAEAQQTFHAAVQSYGEGLKQLSNLIGLASVLDSVDDRYNGLSDLGNALNKGLNNSVSSLGGSAASLNTNLTNYTRLSTNWQESVKKDLQDWRNDVTNRLSHMFDDGVGVKGGNNTSPVVVSGAYGGPVGVAGTVHAVIDNLTLGVQIDKPVEIDHTQLNQISAGYSSITDAVEEFHNSFTDFTTSGNKPFNWIAYYNMFYDFSNSVQSNQVEQISLLSSLTNLMFNYTQNFTNDLIFSISNALVGLSAVSNDYMLLTDYANYINSSGLSDLIDIMDDDTYSDLKDELLGISSLDQADSYGRWWRYFTGLVTVSANSSLRISNLLAGHEKTIHDLSEEPGAKSLLDHFSDLLESIPSQTDIDDKSNQLTNSIDSSGFSALLVDIDTMSNSFNNVSRFFDRGSTLPHSITLDLGLGMPSASANPNPIVLPLSKYRGIMDLLHYGIAFSYCVVNLILLPKFILLLIHLFDKVWRGYDKKLAHSTTV